MRIYKASSYDEMSRKAAHVISALVTLKPDCVLGLATGSSPIGTYKQLIKWYQDGDLDFSQVKTANLDEYKGLTKENDPVRSGNRRLRRRGFTIIRIGTQRPYRL